MIYKLIFNLCKEPNNFQFDGESKNQSCPLSYSFCIFFGSLSGNMAFIASSLLCLRMTNIKTNLEFQLHIIIVIPHQAELIMGSAFFMPFYRKGRVRYLEKIILIILDAIGAVVEQVFKQNEEK